ncbi:hypothetical protein ETD83_02290 [Actinomadura soli]|uniref:Uncharacterized protein n=1 Tax=Actinomadura soli TaxID=2508997 RepID=A0A5C4JLQ8_9ACTN|nr:hypothetical protein [Actinomadura soli]TMR06991.1 hypothetical protein ETD83_02290 [Actinomadura soli]
MLPKLLQAFFKGLFAVVMTLMPTSVPAVATLVAVSSTMAITAGCAAGDDDDGGDDEDNDGGDDD